MASAVDWRVLHTVEYHQNYKTWKCRLSLARIAKVARCSRTRASTSTHRWQNWGFIKITRSGKFNVYEIVRNFQPSPGIVLHTRNISRKDRKRNPKGQYSPSVERKSSPYMDNRSSPSMEHTTIDSSSEILERGSPFPSQRELPTSPSVRNRECQQNRCASSKTMSPKTVEAWMKTFGRKKTGELLKRYGYPLTLLPEEEPKDKE